jgi:hypothetical protein
VPEPGVHASVAVGEVLESWVRDNMAVGEVPEPCRGTAGGAARALLTYPCFRKGGENRQRHGRTKGAIITCCPGNLDGTPVLFPCSLS